MHLCCPPLPRLLQRIGSKVGVSYYDCSVRQLHVLQVWEEDCSDFTFINMGYLMCIFGEKLDETALNRLTEFVFAFSNMDGETQRFFYHTLKTRELDNLLGDIYHKILELDW
ncbi:unnamed protein product [Arabidopsis lyrata]|nr:unnamed protein product [Arabidopsis lyrata]